MDTGNSFRAQTGAGRYTYTRKGAGKPSDGSSQGRASLRGSAEPRLKGCHYLYHRRRRWLCQSALPGTKVRRFMATGDQPARPKPVRVRPAFQDGICENSEGNNPERGLVAETRSQGRLPVGSHSQGTPEVLEVPMGRPDVAVQGPSVRAEQCTADIHQTSETSCLHTPEAGHPHDPIPGRYVDNGPEQARDQVSSGISNQTALCVGLYYKYEEECVQACTGHGVPGVFTGHEGHDDKPSQTEALCDTEDGQSTPPTDEGVSPGTSTVTGNASCSTPGSPASPPPLQSSGEGEEEGSPETGGLRVTGQSGQRDETGHPVVDQSSDQLQWETSSDIQLGSDYRVGCIPQRMGSIVAGKVHRWPMDDRGTQTSYQFSGASSRIPGPEVFCPGEEGRFCSPPFGQCDSHCIYQQDGRYSLNTPVRPGSGDLGLVHPTECHNPRRAPPRSRECEGRLGITSPVRLERLETTPRDFLSLGGQRRPLLDRPICVENEHSASPLLQLEAGPERIGSRRILHLLEEPQSIPVSPICDDSQVPSQTETGGDHSLANSPSLAQSSLVPTAALLPSGTPNPLTSPARHHLQSGWEEPPSGREGTPPPSRLVCIRRSCSSQGFSERVTEVIRRSWRTSTESAYNSAWRQWVGWCMERETDPLSAPVSEVLEFLYERFEAGRQYRTINTLRSAISMTHDEVDGVRIGQHPMVSRFLKGVFNIRPPAPKYTVTWDVDTVLEYICQLPENGDLDLQQLSHKLTMLLALTNADRCSDLAALDLSFHTYSGGGVRFIIPGLTKTRSSGPPLESFYPEFPDERKLCPVETLKAYERRTLPLRKETSKSNSLFISVRKPHRPVKPATLGRWLKAVLSQAGINTDVFSAHSTRGASTSKAKRAGVSLGDIIKAANWSSVSTFSRWGVQLN